MTSLSLVQRPVLHTTIPFLQPGHVERSAFSMKKFKKAYTGLNCMLGWGEKICNPQTAPLLSTQRKLLKLHSSTIDIAEWVETAAKLAGDIGQAKVSSNPVERNK